MADEPTETVERVADELYGLPADEFVAARDERARQARAGGDREAAAAIRRLRRPSTSAWLANMLVRHRPDHVAEVTELGDALRAAQAGLAGEDIRRLGERRRRLVDRLLPEARALADELGHPVGDGVVREFEGTVQAALADADAAEEFAAGRLATALHAGAGFGFELGVAAPSRSSSAARKTEAPERRRQPSRRDGVTKTAQRDAERIARARTEVDEARSAFEAAERTADERREAATEVAAELAAATEKLDDLLAAVDETRRAKADAERRHRVAQRRADQAAHGVQEARRRLDQAERRLDDLSA